MVYPSDNPLLLVVEWENPFKGSQWQRLKGISKQSETGRQI